VERLVEQEPVLLDVQIGTVLQEIWRLLPSENPSKVRAVTQPSIPETQSGNAWISIGAVHCYTGHTPGTGFLQVLLRDPSIVLDMNAWVCSVELRRLEAEASFT
jgi:hypothetical protein